MRRPAPGVARTSPSEMWLRSATIPASTNTAPKSNTPKSRIGTRASTLLSAMKVPPVAEVRIDPSLLLTRTTAPSWFSENPRIVVEPPANKRSSGGTYSRRPDGRLARGAKTVPARTRQLNTPLPIGACAVKPAVARTKRMNSFEPRNAGETRTSVTRVLPCVGSLIELLRSRTNCNETTERRRRAPKMA